MSVVVRGIVQVVRYKMVFELKLQLLYDIFVIYILSIDRCSQNVP